MKYYLMIMLVLTTSLAHTRFEIDLEAGIAFSGYNNVRIPNESNTSSDKFSFTHDLETDPVFVSRINAHYYVSEQHRISFLYAPFSVEPSGKFDRDIEFREEIFNRDIDILGTYRFDSYRLQYRYYFKDQSKLYRAIGLTAKIRDAEISLAENTKKATKKNTGFVPIINFLLVQNLYPGIDLFLDGDALFSPYGRAADVMLGVSFDFDERYSLRAGYRVLEGGSDVDEVYTFALINYAVLNVKVRL